MTPPRLAMEHTDRSNSLMLITSVAPMEMITIREIWREMFRKFFTVKKALGRSRLNTRMMTARASSVP